MNERSIQIILFIVGILCLLVGVILIVINNIWGGGVLVFVGLCLIFIGAIGPSTIKNFEFGWRKGGPIFRLGRYKHSEKKLETIHKFAEISANPIAEISTNPRKLSEKIETPEVVEFSLKRREVSQEESKILKKAAQEIPPAEIKIKAEKLIEEAGKRTERERAPEDYLMLAVKAWEDKNFEGGLGWVYSGLNLKPKNDETKMGLYNALGSIYQELKSYELAEKNLKKALEIDKKAYWVHGNLGNTYYYQKKYDDAERAYKEALELYPDNYATHANLGALFYIQKKLPEAEKENREAIRLNPTKSKSQTNLGFLLFDTERYEKALTQFNVALEIKSNSDNYAGKAISLSKLGRQKEALSTYKTAVSLDPEFKKLEVLKEKYFWSEQACEAARELIDRL